VFRIPLADLKRAVEEQRALRGLHVDNVYQCDGRTFLLKLDPGKVFLVIDLTAGRARVLVTDDPPPVPDSPPVLGSILRRALRGGRFLGTMLLAEDRVVAVDVEVAGEPRRLVAEALPRHGNLLLLDREGRVERVLDGEAAKRRGNGVGSAYTLPRAPAFREEPSLLPPGLEGPFAANHALDRMAREVREDSAQDEDGKDRARARARLEKTRDAVERDLRELPDPAAIRAQGQLLLARFTDLRAGMAKFEGVEMDPKLQPHENVDRVFERARKAERARPVLEARLREISEQIVRIDAGEPVPAPVAHRRKGRREPPRLPYRSFVSLEGRTILVGKGGADNDETTLKVARPHDLFLHVRGTPGAHVIVRLDRGETVGEQTLLDAATLALHYSRMRRADRAEVTWTPRRNVSKPKGAKPGLVRVTHETVLLLRREPERLARLLMTAGEGE
jgi:predicted ribosome quality control (RQC) complex YloA/Tae2 family protein